MDQLVLKSTLIVWHHQVCFLLVIVKMIFNQSQVTSLFAVKMVSLEPSILLQWLTMLDPIWGVMVKLLATIYVKSKLQEENGSRQMTQEIQERSVKLKSPNEPLSYSTVNKPKQWILVGCDQGGGQQHLHRCEGGHQNFKTIPWQRVQGDNPSQYWAYIIQLCFSKVDQSQHLRWFSRSLQHLAGV